MADASHVGGDVIEVLGELSRSIARELGHSVWGRIRNPDLREAHDNAHPEVTFDANDPEVGIWKNGETT